MNIFKNALKGHKGAFRVNFNVFNERDDDDTASGCLVGYFIQDKLICATEKAWHGNIKY